ncbi:MAG: M67 family metallopeptidase [Nitrospirota bacterium]
MADLIIKREQLAEIISHSKEIYPREACGILSGKEGVVQKVYKMTNIENSSVSYVVDSKEQFAVMKEIRKDGLEMVAIYHSHPYSDAYPSPRDIKLAFYTELFYLIVSLADEEPEIKAFRINHDNVKEVEIKVILE